MNGKPHSSRAFLFLLIGAGLASAGAVIYALRVISQKSDLGSTVPSENLVQVQQVAAIQKIRHQMAEEFITAVANCGPIQNLKNEILTEQQVTERVVAALEDREDNLCTKDKKGAWTFSAPCTLTIHHPPAWLGGSMNLGSISLCATTIGADFHSGVGGCRSSRHFDECLVNAVLADHDVQKEIVRLPEGSR
ncbi:MAG TPA: hypothetical protein VEK34_07180 [Methylocella sp.]|nr:hypothetical protein [Methylocella sp.]